MGKDTIKQIIRDLEDRGHSLADIGRELRVSRQHVGRVLRRPWESKRVRDAIVAKLGRDPFADQDASAA